FHNAVIGFATAVIRAALLINACPCSGTTTGFGFSFSLISISCRWFAAHAAPLSKASRQPC
ncbi:MAG TPA: hypothetical protein VHK27_06675, partial [Gammaproteobacteria bacterium]|nr:hypothetical protein [Gammaproteobacteria bacterium]